MSANVCSSAGLVVGGEYPVPDDLTDHFAALLPLIGCNRLRCTACGAMVRSARGFGRKLKDTSVAEIYDAPDLTKAPDIVATSDAFRFYVCRCVAHLENRWRRMDERDVDVKDGIELPWRCAGHPTVELPHAFDGAQVASAEELEALVRRVAAGEVPPGAPRELAPPAVWLARLFAWVAGTPLQAGVARAIVALLDAPDARQRSHALHAVILAQPAEGRRRVLEILEGDRAGFAGVPDVSPRTLGDETLEDALWRALRSTIAGVERARVLARKEALAPGKGRRAIFDSLSEHDTDWLIEHAAEIAAAAPGATDALLESADHNFPENGSFARLMAKLKR